MYYRNRYFSTKFKSFISEDPIGLAGGMNQYAYVEGNPISYNDLMGLRFLLVHFWGTTSPFQGSLGHAALSEMDGTMILNQWPNNLFKTQWESPNVFIDSLNNTDMLEKGKQRRTYKIFVPDDNAFNKQANVERNKQLWALMPSDGQTNCSQSIYNAISAGGINKDLLSGYNPYSTPMGLEERIKNIGILQ